MTLIPFREAQRILGLSDAGLFQGSFKYEKFIYKGRGFNLEAYQKQEELFDRITKMTMLFVEYLKNIEDINYTQMEVLVGVSKTSLSAHSFGYKASLRVLSGYAVNRPELIARFDSYYNFKHNNRWNGCKLQRISKELFNG